jgi:hypothetical protein
VIVLFHEPAPMLGIDQNPICIDLLTFDNQVKVKVKVKALVQLMHSSWMKKAGSGR